MNDEFTRMYKEEIARRDAEYAEANNLRLFKNP